MELSVASQFTLRFAGSFAGGIFYKDDTFLLTGLYNQQVIMGGCVSTPPKAIRKHKKHVRRFGKRHMKISSSRDENKLSSDTGCVTDFAVSQYVQMDFENGKTAGAANSTYHLKQMQWHLSQVGFDGTSFILWLSEVEVCA